MSTESEPKKKYAFTCEYCNEGCGQLSNAKACVECERRARETYNAFDPATRDAVDQRVRDLSERSCEEKNAPRYDVWTTVGGDGKTTLYDVAKAFGIAPSRSVTYARARGRMWLMVILHENAALADQVAPRKRYA